MSIWKWVGGVAGGAVGFVASGFNPAGAAAGAAVGYGIGAGADEKNAASDATDANNAAASNIKVSPSAWNTGPGLMVNTPEGQAAQTAAQQAAITTNKEWQDASAEAERLRKIVYAMDPGVNNSNPEWWAAKKQMDDALARAQDAQVRAKQADAAFRAGPTDASVSLARSDAASKGVAPTLGPTLLTRNDADFSRANDTLRQQGYDFRAQQLAQAQALQSGAGREGQQALIDRLNGDLNGKQPSLAELQLQEGRDAAINNSLSIANSARGNSQGLSQIEALRANERTMQGTSRSAAMLRAEEYAKARGELGTALSQQRGQDLQGQNIAATELGQGRQQDIGVAGIQSQNALSQAQIIAAQNLSQANLDQDTKKANLLAYFQQQGINNQMAEYWADKYTHYQERPTDLAIDREKTQSNIASDIYHTTVNQNNANLDRQQKSDAATAQGFATFGTALALKPSGGGGVNGGTPGATTPTANSYTDNTIVDPWKQTA